MYRLLTSLSASHPSVSVRNVIDDISAQALGTSFHVVSELGAVGSKLVAGLRQLRLVLSEKKM